MIASNMTPNFLSFLGKTDGLSSEDTWAEENIEIVMNKVMSYIFGCSPSSN